MNLYIGNLSYSVSEDDLRNIFSEYGKVSSVKIVSDRYSGKSRGFGFVEMEDSAQAEKAITEVNGREIQGRAITVNKARPQNSSDNREKGNKRFRG